MFRVELRVSIPTTPAGGLVLANVIAAQLHTAVKDLGGVAHSFLVEEEDA